MKKRWFPFLSVGFPLLLIYLLLSRVFLFAHVKEDSMEPTLKNGQTILLMKKAKTPHRGDIVVFPAPDKSCLLVKRCILTEGDPIKIEFGWLISDSGRYFLTESQRDYLLKYSVVPPGCFFAVGDNQFYSIDSRDYGFINVNALIGKVILMNKGQ